MEPTTPIDQMNPQQPMTPPQAPAPQGNGGHKASKAILVLVVIVAIVLLAIALFGKQADMGPTQDVSTPEEQTTQDLGNLEAELDATVFEGISEGL